LESSAGFRLPPQFSHVTETCARENMNEARSCATSITFCGSLASLNTETVSSTGAVDGCSFPMAPMEQRAARLAQAITRCRIAICHLGEWRKTALHARVSQGMADYARGKRRLPAKFREIN